jgi:hypothetical protein
MNIFLALADRYLWFLALAATVVYAYVLQARFAALGAAHAERAPGYERMLTWFTGLSGGLWVLMGAAIIAGGVPGVSAFLNPAAGGLWVIVWHGAFVGLLLGGAVWIFLRGGAQFLAEHPGLLPAWPPDAAAVKRVYGVVVALALAAELMIW